MERSTEIVYDFLTPWAAFDTVLKACREIIVNTDHEVVRARAYATATEYLLAERGRVLKAAWDETDAKPGSEDVEKVNPDREMMFKLNGICGFYGTDRVIIHLYLHMFLLQALNGQYGSYLAELDATVDRYYRP